MLTDWQLVNASTVVMLHMYTAKNLFFVNIERTFCTRSMSCKLGVLFGVSLVAVAPLALAPG